MVYIQTVIERNIDMWFFIQLCGFSSLSVGRKHEINAVFPSGRQPNVNLSSDCARTIALDTRSPSLVLVVIIPILFKSTIANRSSNFSLKEVSLSKFCPD